MPRSSIAREREAVLHGRPSDRELTEQLLAPLYRSSRAWRVAVAVCGAETLLLVALIAYTLWVGIGAWGNNIPVAWGLAIINFIWWGHAGALISAVLLLLGWRWRVAVGRIAETMALFALLNSAIFPLLHLGRPWFFYWMFPYPSTLGVWPQYLSALAWDVIGILALLVVTGLFWYVGLLPDLAEIRDHSSGRWRRRIYGVLAIGWKGSGRDWRHYRIGNGLLAGLVVAMAVSMHSIASLDLGTSIVPGWHATNFPPSFVVKSIHSGLAMTLFLALLLRHVHELHNVLTRHHVGAIAIGLVATAWIVLYSYVMEGFVAWYSGNEYERYVYFEARTEGPYAIIGWLSLALAFGAPQLFWWRRMRESIPVAFGVALLIVAGMWLERFLVVVSSLNRGYLPSEWSFYGFSWVEAGILAGSISLFGLLLLLALRIVPLVPVSEMKEMRRGLHPEEA